MKKLFKISMGLVIALLSVVLVSCSDDFSNDVTQPQKKSEDPTPDPQPEKKDSTDWGACMRKNFKVYENADVYSWMYAHKGGEGKQTTLDSLTLKYKYVFSLAADTTLYLSAAPEGALTFTTAIDHTEYSEYTHNAQGDSVCNINYSKPYYLSDGANLYLKTTRVRGWHNMGGKPEMYKEPDQRVGQLQIGSSTDEFEKNDTIWGRRINLCSIELTLGDKKFVPSCKVTEIWFSRLKEKPEPSFDYKVDGLLKFVCGCKVKNNIGWADGIMFEGKDNIYFVIDNYNQSGKAMGRELHTTPKERVVFNSQVNGIVYDSTTGLYAPALIVSDKSGWNCEGFVDGRSVTCDRSNTQAIDEGIKCFVDKDTSVPSVFFASTPSTSVKEWHGKKYITVNWSKYSPDTDLVTRTVTVAEK